jgi:CRP/FNR family transcriptional regulator
MQKLHPDILGKRFPFFEPKLLNDLTKVGILKEVEEGMPLIDEGQYIRSFPLVLEGIIRIFRMDENGNEILLYYLNPGDVCALSLTCCMSKQQSSVKAIAEEFTTVLMVPIEYIDTFMSKHSTWKEFVMYSYQKRFNELLETIDGIAFLKMDERLVKFFNDRYATTNETIFKGTHQEIANALNSSREVISRLLKKLEKDQRIKISRNQIDYSELL